MKARIGIGSPLLRDFMRHKSIQRARPLGGIARRGRIASMFNENEILVTRRDNATMDYLVSKLGGEVLEARPLPERPRELAHLPMRSIEGMPEWVRVKIKADNVPQDALWECLGREADGNIELSSNAAAGTLSAALLLRSRGLGGRLNHAGRRFAFPLTVASENPANPTDNNPFNWPEYTGKSQITRAWQLCQALDNVRSMQNPIFIGVIDTGFTNITTDYATPGLSISDGKPLFGPAGEGYAWHGNAVAGVAAARVNNKMGAGGVAGIPVGPAGQPVAIPFLFRSEIDDDEVIYGIKCCVAWGIHVVNMSFGIDTTGLFGGWIDGDWDDTFQFAHDQGLIMIAAAGNDGADLPDDLTLYPATRTPGVITVGALDRGDGTFNVPRGDSNYGSSVDIWAPGTSLHTVPDPNSMGRNVGFTQTSAAAPLVAGVAALMKSANPALRPDDIKTIMRETAWTGSPNPRSNRILDAYQAVLRAINYALPAGIFEEPNDHPGAAKAMQTQSGSPNVFVPFGETVISRGQDVDYHRFTLAEYGDVSIALTKVDALSLVSMEVIPEFEGLALDNFSDTRGPNLQSIVFKNAPPGNYLVKVRGNGPNYYKLRVTFVPKPLAPDLFEMNETKETAARIRLRKPNDWDLFGAHMFFQGAYSANIKNPSDVDWYHITDIGQQVLTFPCCQISEADAPLDVSLFAADGSLINTWAQVKRVDVKLPTPECFIRVTCSRANRYVIAFFYQLDQSKLPDPHQVPDITIIPEWWPDPPFELRGWEKWYQVEIDEDLRRHGVLHLESDLPVQWDLLSTDRSVLQSGVKKNGAAEKLDVKDLAPGKYLLRVGRDDHAAARFQPTNRASVKFSIGPGF